MRLHELSLTNFRQFRDESATFAVDRDRNVTVFHGPNGSGKTTLLNAFTWILYGEVDFDTRPDRLANEGAMAHADPGDRVTVAGSLRFEHDGTRYRATRSRTVEKRTDGGFDGEVVDSDLTLEYDLDGDPKRRDNPTVALEKILPPRLSELFFFDGEDIDELAGIDNQDRIQESIQNIMGLTILERSISHLEDVEDRFEDELREHGSSELQSLIDEKRELDSTIESVERKLEGKRRTTDRLETEIDDLEAKLERMSESSALAERRREEREERASLRDRVDEIEGEIRSEISRRGYLPFAMEAFEETAKDLDDLREKGHIPSELSTRFVDDLLEDESCICGRPLEPDTEPYEAVAGMRSDASVEGVDQAAVQLIGRLGEISSREAEFFETAEAKVDQRRELEEQIARKNELIDEISVELEELDDDGGDSESPAELERARKETVAEREATLREIGKLEEQLERYREDREDLAERIDAARDEAEKAETARRRRKAAELTRKRLDDSFDDLQSQVRNWSDTLINQTFDRIAQKNLEAEITDEFELRIRQVVGDEVVEVDKSTGERQIASLAFIGSLVSIAKQRYESDTDSPYFTGGIYPIAMDSPFGALDLEHRRQVSKIVPELADQVIVMVTNSQWEGPVEEEMSAIAGEQYDLEFRDGDGTDEYPRTRIANERAAAMEGRQ